MKTFISILFLFILTNTASAIDVVAPSGNTILPTIADTPMSAIAAVINFLILLTSILAVMAITWGGIGFILSTGDDEKMKKARKTIIFAFVGLVVAGLAYSIVEMITRAQI